MLSQQPAFYLQQLQETTVRVCSHVLDGSKPILQVIRSAAGDWHFLCGADHEHDYHEGPPMSLEEMIKRDVSLNQVAALEPHDFAERSSQEADWQFGDQLALEIPAVIKKHGWFVANVHDESSTPATYFAYSIGMPTTMKHPELIMLGHSNNLMAKAINDLGAQIRDGSPCPLNTEIYGILSKGGLVCKPMHVTWYRDYLGYGLWFHGDEIFAVLQAFWPDANGLYPWDEGCDPVAATAQPDLSLPKQ